MTSNAGQNHHDPVLDRIRPVMADLLQSIQDVVGATVGENPRPSKLIQQLGLDKSLASRVIKTVRCADELEALESCPAPQGLRLFIRAAREAGAAAKMCAEAETHVARFEDILDGLPGGRSSLSTLTCDWLPETRLRAERAAKLSIYRAMTHLVGAHAEVSFLTGIFHPSDADGFLDAVIVGAMVDLRRLRRKHPILCLNFRNTDDPELQVETLDGERGASDAEAYLLRDFCSTPVPKIDPVDIPGAHAFVLGPDAPEVNVSTTLPFAYVARKFAPTWGTESDDSFSATVTPRVPAKVVVQDLFVRRDVFQGQRPIVETLRQGFPGRGCSWQTDGLDLRVDTESFDGAIPRSAKVSIPKYTEMLESVFAQIGRSVADYRAFRASITYPLTSVMLRSSFARPPRPAGP